MHLVVHHLDSGTVMGSTVQIYEFIQINLFCWIFLQLLVGFSLYCFVISEGQVLQLIVLWLFI